jgi:hypothetical protein
VLRPKKPSISVQTPRGESDCLLDPNVAGRRPSPYSWITSDMDGAIQAEPSL